MIYKWIVLLPLFASVLSGLFLRNIKFPLAPFVTTVSTFVAAFLSFYVFFTEMGEAGKVVTLFNWVSTGDLSVAWELKIDALTRVMLPVVTGVSALVHLYSVGYMAEDESKNRFFSYLSLFTFMMLSLVTANNLLQLFFGWEGVGLASYLLIGFWYYKKSACDAAMKAFIVNRVADAALICGLGLLFVYTGSVNFSDIFAAQPELSAKTVSIFNNQLKLSDVICLALFIGAMGKSAQFILHVWLPDAMEGPTPVSALIHAATMVTAGVFLLARCSPLFEFSSEYVRNLIIFIGAFTSLFAATVALTQNDIKRVIAYSTCSQLGYMFFALGVGAPQAAIFHLFTHAFFKAMLFLGAGAVIHAVHHEQDMRFMGGLRKKLPFTFALMVIGTLAITGFGIPGVFGFSGMYSKDAIIEAAYVSNLGYGKFAFALGALVAFLTSLYSWRVVFLTFFGSPRGEGASHAHEAPLVMALPVLILSVAAVLSGALFAPHFIGHDMAAFWREAIVVADLKIFDRMHHVPALVKYIATIASVSGLLIAWLLFRNGTGPASLSSDFSGIYRFLLGKWYIDELYEAIFVRPFKKISAFLALVVDKKFIDATVEGIPVLSAAFSGRVLSERAHNGEVSRYAFLIFIGAILLIFLTISLGK